ncbi:response regulator [Vitiosangium sp. GDMCC 1.1324]|uniref:hybrid sensor histidine kinase/response regulator n=1 Tax=Vitiosangium sp. (strain GDMCC 1.1324) TaxID=2138576 RepID=UPI00130D6A7C|nr:response regulator [Vitiosangium sp. GDMCC 1.1324]
MSVDDSTQVLLTTFSVEARELCRTITRELMTLERGSAPPEALVESFDNLARALHTLKGGAGTLELEDLAAIAHRMEDALAPLQDAGRMPPERADAFLQGLDVFGRRLRAHQEGRTTGLPDLAATLVLFDDPASLAEAPPVAPEPGPVQPARAEAEDAGWWMRPAQLHALVRDVERFQELRLRLEQRLGELDRVIHAMRHPGRAPRGMSPLLMLEDVRDALAEDREEAGELAGSVERNVQDLSTAELHTLLEPLQRGVRDLCRRTGKEAQLSLLGGELSVDQRVLSMLSGVLAHLVRNAVDHGLERPEERQRRGKHRVGALLLRAERVGNLVVLEMSDDGSGLDTEALRRAALAMGLLPAERLAAMTAAEVHQLIFRKGLSTREQVTETSGRGVGLDAVRSQVLALEGQLEVHSLPGQGTRFVITLPEGLGTSPVLGVRVGEHTLGLPLSSVDCVCTAPASEVRGDVSPCLVLREERMPLVDLAERLGLPPGPPVEELRLVLIHARGRRLALRVDSVLDERHLAVRPLPPALRHLPAWQGAAALPGGEFLPVLRSDWLATEGPVPGARRGRRALVVDDSLTARALHRTMLEAGGFQVYTAATGAQALALAARLPLDVVVVDVAMAEMDGRALTSQLRARPSTSAVPIILVSASDSDSERDAGLASGADAFLGKRECRAGRLLAVVEDLLVRPRLRASAPGSPSSLEAPASASLPPVWSR